MPTWVQCKKTRRFIPKEEWLKHGSDAPYIQGDIESFKSPIDGSIISDRAQLREHNKRHGVTDSRDYSQEYYEKAAKKRQIEHAGAAPWQKRDRIETIKRVLDHYERN